MNWADVGVPDYIVGMKTAWDRRHRVFRAVEAGATRRSLAHHLGISYTAISRIYALASRDVRQNRPDPIEAWFHSQEGQAILERRDMQKIGLQILPPNRDWLII